MVVYADLGVTINHLDYNNMGKKLDKKSLASFFDKTYKK